MAASKKIGRGRPQSYPLNGNQEKQIISRLKKGVTSNAIAEELGVHQFAVLRVRRKFNAENSPVE